MSKQGKKIQIKGRQILLLGLVALVITAGYYRWTIESASLSASMPTAGEALPEEAKNESNEAKGQGGGELDTLKRERDLARSKSVEEWQKIASGGDASAEAKRDAEKKVAIATENADKERKIETMVKAKGYDDCFASVDEAGVSVTVKGGEIDGAKVAQIKDIIVSETGVSSRNIKINAM